MAKWGEGDPRWIVEERPDATNVNNWHWTEKNADQWSKKKLEELFKGLVLEGEAGARAEVTSMDKCDGEARANNRKAKLIFFYEWELVLAWKGTVGDAAAEGKITIPNLSEEHTDMKDVDVEVTANESTKASGKLKDFLRKGAGANIIREQLAKYVQALKEEYSQGIILETKKDGSNQAAVPKPAPSIASSSSSGANASTASAMKRLDIGKSAGEVSIETLEIEETFKCTKQELFNSLTQKEMIQIYTGSPVKMDEAKAGENFSLMDGVIEGRFLELQPFERILQTWRLKDWPSGHYSKVEITLKQGKEDTKLKLRQTGVPSKSVEATKVGWKSRFFEAIKRSFGFGSVLF